MILYIFNFNLSININKMSKIEENQSDKSTMIDFEGKKLLLKIQVEKDYLNVHNMI